MKGKLGLHKDAIESLRACISIDKKNASAHLNLGNYLAITKDVSGSLEAYREACIIAPGDPKMLRNLAYVLIEQGELEEGVELLRKLLKATPDDAEIVSYLEQCQAELGMKVRIKEDIKAGLEQVEKDPKNVGIRANLAMAMKANGDFEGAAAQFEECLKLQPGHPQIEAFLKDVKDAAAKKEAEDEGEAMGEEQIIHTTGRFSMFGGKKKGRQMIGRGGAKVAVAG